jgi:hypothetical protein
MRRLIVLAPDIVLPLALLPLPLPRAALVSSERQAVGVAVLVIVD